MALQPSRQRRAAPSGAHSGLKRRVLPKLETALHFFPSSQVRMSISWQDFCRIMGLVSWELRQLPRTKEWAWCQ